MFQNEQYKQFIPIKTLNLIVFKQKPTTYDNVATTYTRTIAIFSRNANIVIDT